MENELFANQSRTGTVPPACPGVYFFRDGRGHPIYIGKAKLLCDRLASYRQKAQPAKTMAMLAAARSLDWIVLKTEFEALLCEASMIRQYKPRYNIDLRDDKHFPSILLTDEPFPKALKVRRSRRGQGRHFGPFPASTCKALLEILSRRFRIRRCGGPLPKRDRPCIDFDIGRCDAPCVKKISREEYGLLVDQAAEFLGGDIRTLVKEFDAEMKLAAADRQYEDAAALRDEIAAMRGILARQDAERPTRDDADAIAVASGPNVAVAVVLARRKGVIADRARYVFDLPIETEPSEIARRTLEEHYRERVAPRMLLVAEELGFTGNDVILVPESTPAPRPRVPLRGPERAFLGLAQQNAAEGLRIVSEDRSTALRNQALVDLMNALTLTTVPRSIEGFDNSTFAGKDTVAACVRFEDGLPRKTGYRMYRIRGRQDSDVDAMREVLTRRGAGKDPLPDLILIDGGMGQLLAAHGALATALDGTARTMPVMVSLEKREELVRTLEGEIIRLPRSNAGLRLLQQVRDEAHRFGKNYHTKLRTKRAGLK